MFESSKKTLVFITFLILFIPALNLVGAVEEGSNNEYDVASDFRDPQETCLVKGYVNNTTGSPLDDVKIYIEDSAGNENETETDGTGWYSIYVRPGQTQIKAMYRGYRGYDYNINAQEGLNLNNNFTLSLLGPELVTITGYINDSEDNPLPNSVIYLTDSDTWENFTFTDAQGHYTINCVEGSVLIVAINASFAPMFRHLNVSNNTVYYVDFVMSPPPEPTATISGYVRDKEGDPLVGIEVFVINNTHMYHNVTYTDATGYFQLGVIDDWLHLIVEPDGYFEFHEYILVKENDTLYYNITLIEKGPQTAHYFGTVIDEETGLPIENASVEAELMGVHWSMEANTNAQGEFELYLYEGEYEITVSAFGYFQDGSEIIIGADQDIEEDFELEPTPPINSVIKGHIRDIEGDPMDARGVMLLDMINETQMGVGTDDGYFEMPIWEGIFLVAAIADGHSVSAKNVYVPDNSTVWVNLTMLEATSFIRGYVKDPEGDPLPHAKIQFMDDKTIFLGDFETDEEGYYELKVHGSTFAVIVTDEDDDLFESSKFEPYTDEHVISEDEDYWMNFTLYEADPQVMFNTLDLSDWNNPVMSANSILTVNKSIQMALFFDIYFGNNDLSISASEADYIDERFMEEMLKETDDEEDDDKIFFNDTSDKFLLDGTYFLLNEDGVELDFQGLMGDWDTIDSVELVTSAPYNSSVTIEDNLTHHLEINLSWKYHDENVNSTMNIIFPDRYASMGWEEIENVTAEMGNPMVIEEGYNPNTIHEEDEPEEGIDYIWTDFYVNKTFEIVDISDETGSCGGNLTIGVEVDHYAEVGSVELEYQFEDDNQSTFVQLLGNSGVYTHTINLSDNRTDPIYYRFKIEIEPYYILPFPEMGYGIINISDGIAPEAKLSAHLDLVNTGNEVVFDASLSMDNIGILSYNFSFGDGSYELTSNDTVDYSYNQTGNYTASVNVTDLAGNHHLASVKLKVINDTKAPEVLNTTPTDGYENVSLDAMITILLSEDVILQDVILLLNNKTVNYTYDTEKYLITLFPDEPLDFGKKYTIELSARDEIGNWLEDFTFSFITIKFEDFDSDGDGVPNWNDDFPNNPTGTLDTDNDGKPDELLSSQGWNGTELIEDLDDDNDNWTDNEEIRLKTDPKDALSYPPDLDGDGTADSEDEDIDGDGVPNEEDEDPNDPEVGKKGSGSESEGGSSMVIILIVVVILIAIAIAAFLFMRKDRGKDEFQGEDVSHMHESGDLNCSLCDDGLEQGSDGGLICERCGAEHDDYGMLLDETDEGGPVPEEDVNSDWDDGSGNFPEEELPSDDDWSDDDNSWNDEDEFDDEW